MAGRRDGDAKASSFSQSIDELGDFTPHVSGDDGFAILDFLRLEIGMSRHSFDRHDQARRARMSLGAPGLALYRFERDLCTLQFLADMSRNFQLAEFERREWQWMCSRGLSTCVASPARASRLRGDNILCR